jgi:hypothetical protein
MMTVDKLKEDPPDLQTNSTDYNLPPNWGLMSDEQKSEWYLRERVYRQACRQDTAFGRRYREQQSQQQGIPLAEAWDRAEHGGYRYDE